MTGGTSSVELRVRHAETDQMGVAHHANYLVWCEAARTAHMRHSGISYRELEEQGLLLEERSLLATARTSLIAVDSKHALRSIPPQVLAYLEPVVDPVRL